MMQEYWLQPNTNTYEYYEQVYTPYIKGSGPFDRLVGLSAQKRTVHMQLARYHGRIVWHALHNGVHIVSDTYMDEAELTQEIPTIV